MRPERKSEDFGWTDAINVQGWEVCPGSIMEEPYYN